MKTRYWLDCPCGQKLAVAAKQAGEIVRCACGADLQVPALRDLSRLASVVVAPAATARGKRSFWGRRQARVLLGAFVMFFACAALLLLEMARPRLVNVELLPPVQVWTLWQDLRRGPDRNLAAAEQEIVDSLGMFRTGETIMAVCAAAGLLWMVVGYVTPGRTVPRPPAVGPRTVSRRSSQMQDSSLPIQGQLSPQVRQRADQPRNYGPLSPCHGHARITGPCGDTMEFWVRVDQERVSDVGFTTTGCSSSRAAGSMATELAVGTTLEVAAQIGQADILAALGGLPPESEHCALLAANTLRAAIADGTCRDH